MYCPSCKDEFRAGFTRCAACDVDLVESLDDVAAAGTDEAPAPRPGDPLMIRMREYCGFLELDEARGAREQLRGAGIAADILIRDVPDPDGVPVEEYWLRVDADRVREAIRIVGEDPGAAEDR